MSSSRCSYCGEWCDHPLRLSFCIGGRDRESARFTTLNLCTACSNSWCTDRSLRSGQQQEWVGTLQKRRAG
jgi:hypothetical protein